jgi:hypothetical protein
MPSGALRRVLVVVGCAAMGMTLSACESTEQESARIGREGQKLAAGPAALRLGAVNHRVRVSDVTVLTSAGRTAVAARLTSTTARPQADVPVLVNVTGRGGKLLYSNEAGGVESSLQHIALLRPGQSAWWVDDQVLATKAPTAAKVRIGTGSVPPSSPPTLSTRGVHTSRQSGINVIGGDLVNGSARGESQVPIFAVAVRGGRVVAAGRAVVSALPAHAGASVPFQIFLVGDPAGARLELTAVPTAG